MRRATSIRCGRTRRSGSDWTANQALEEVDPPSALRLTPPKRPRRLAIDVHSDLRPQPGEPPQKTGVEGKDDDGAIALDALQKLAHRHVDIHELEGNEADHPLLRGAGVAAVVEDTGLDEAWADGAHLDAEIRSLRPQSEG